MHRTIWISVATWLVIPLSIAVFATVAFLPSDWTTINSKTHRMESVTLIRPGFAMCLGYLGIGCLLALFILAAIGVWRKAIVFTLAALATSLMCPFSVAVHVVSNLAPWQIYSELRAPDGTVYCFAESSFLQGQSLMLARLRHEDFFTRTIDAIAETNGDNPRMFLLVVRPADAKDHYGKLNLTDEGWLLALRYANQCYFAYHLQDKQPMFRESVNQLSPFLMVGKSDHLHEADVASLVHIGIREDRHMGAPSRDAVQKGLSHPNDQIRKLAKSLLEKQK